jgi:prevent-host-death family protein
VPKSFSIADARNRLTRVVHEVETGQPVELTRRGKPVAVIVSAREFERLARRRGCFSSALRRFRTENHLQKEGIDPRLFVKIRDASPGREVIV